jgi:hypothetical protein
VCSRKHWLAAPGHFRALLCRGEIRTTIGIFSNVGARSARKAQNATDPPGAGSGFPLVFLQTPALAGEGGLYLSRRHSRRRTAGKRGRMRSPGRESNLGHLREIPALIFRASNRGDSRKNTRGDAGGNET